MNKIFTLAPLLAFSLAACEQPAEEPPAEEEKLGDYKALGTEPGWTAEVKGEEIIFSSMEGNDFTVPIDKMEKTETGWQVRGYDAEKNINITITSGQECSDGMSDRNYADTVKAAVLGSGSLSGCGGEITEGADTAP